MSSLDTSPNDSRATQRASRRSFLQAVGAVPVLAAASLSHQKLPLLANQYAAPPPDLLRSRDGRRLSRARYRRAESFFLPLASGQPLDRSNMLYQAGIVAQLALSAHLLDMGFADQWCARWIGLRVAKALAYANATGLGHDDPDMGRLAAVLTPYGVWRQPRAWDEPVPDDGGFTADQVRPLLRALLDRVKSVTGHPRPKGWHHDRLECRS